MNKTAQTLKIQTRDFGEVEILKDSIITFPNGIFAFEECRSFALLSPLGEGTYPMWLQATDDVKPCFIVFDPKSMLNGYEPTLLPEDYSSIKLSEGEEPAFLSIAVIHDDYMDTTINLKSPIIINTEKRIATQVILSEDFDIKFPLFKDSKGE